MQLSQVGPFYIPVMRLPQLRNQYSYITMTEVHFIQTAMASLLRSRIPSEITHDVESLRLLCLLWSTAVSQMFPVVRTLTVLRSTGQAFGGMPLLWDLFHVVLMAGLESGREKAQR